MRGDRGQQHMPDALIIQRRATTSSGSPDLLLLFHGVGANANDLEPLGRFLAQQRPRSACRRGWPVKAATVGSGSR
jgi:predicted esterase